MSRPQIALFGGSFDPPHLGHVLAAVHARSVGGCTEVWILPCAVHPWAKALSPWDRRWALCQAAFGTLGPWCQVRNDEQANPSGFTYDLVVKLRRENPGADFLLMGGSDTGQQLPAWHRGDELARIIGIHVVPRGGHDAGISALPPVSSTLVRKLLLTQDPAVAELLPRGVLDQIRHHDWYRTTRSDGP